MRKERFYIYLIVLEAYQFLIYSNECVRCTYISVPFFFDELIWNCDMLPWNWKQRVRHQCAMQI
jgi:hypothetical protein